MSQSCDEQKIGLEGENKYTHEAENSGSNVDHKHLYTLDGSDFWCNWCQNRDSRLSQDSRANVNSITKLTDSHGMNGMCVCVCVETAKVKLNRKTVLCTVS